MVRDVGRKYEQEANPTIVTGEPNAATVRVIVEGRKLAHDSFVASYQSIEDLKAALER